MRLLLLMSLLVPRLVLSQNYAASGIAPNLRADAHAVIRQHETTYHLHSPGEATERVRSVVTILDARGQNYATEAVGYDKLSKVTLLEGRLYDAAGKEIRRLKKADIQDVSAISDGSLYEDNRMKVARFAYASYPFTVEFIVETTTKNTLFSPRWFLQEAEHVALESASLQVVFPETLPLRHKELNGLAAPQEGRLEVHRTLTWKLGPLPARTDEPLKPRHVARGPGVLTAPSTVEVEGYRGSLNTWRELGQFFYQLNQNRDALPDAVKQRLRAQVGTETDPARKVAKVYEFVQQTTRYISVQLGIGGWQTLPAQAVAETGYGDCKALSNYTKALLKTVGVDSHWAVIQAGSGRPDVIADFPSLQFNHMILCVPLPQDTLWLECTDQHDPAGYAGGFTGNRHALLLTPEGGYLAATPRYAATDNRQARTAAVRLTETGDAAVDLTTRYAGLQQDDRSQVMTQLGRDDQRTWLTQRIGLPSFELNDFQLTRLKNRLPEVTETLRLSVRKWASRSGERLFVPLNLLSPSTYVPPTTTERQADFEISVGFLDTDSVRYQLPAGWQPEYQPEPLRHTSRFGTYESRVVVQDGTLIYVRRLLLAAGQYPAREYPAYVAFRRAVAKADRAQVVLVPKKT